MNGKPLIRHAIDHAEKDWKSTDLTIIVSPENSRAIMSLAKHDYNYVVQPSPLGVVDAIARGLPFCCGQWTLILCADNTFTLGDDPIKVPPAGPIFGARALSAEEQRRFTRFKKRPVFDRHVYPGVEVIEAASEYLGEGVWIGPLLLPTHLIEQSLRSEPKTVVELIRGATQEGKMLQPLFMRCEDLGMPEELQ